MTSLDVRPADAPGCTALPGGLAALLPGRDALLRRLADVLPFATTQATSLVLLGLRSADGGPVASDDVDACARLLAASVRADDWFGLAGPAVFAVVLAGTADDADSLATRALATVGSAGHDGLTACAGLVLLSAALTPPEALRCASAGLTEACTVGRERIVAHHRPH